MIFKDEYIPLDDQDTENSVDLESLYQNSYIGNTLLNILGSYWHDHYEDMDNLHLLAGSITALIGTEYQSILQQVISSSIVDTPVQQAVPYQLFSFNSRDANYVYAQDGSVERIEFSYPGLEGIEFLSSGLLDSMVVLTRGEYFSIENGVLSFYIDIFKDSYIDANAYVFTTSDLQPTPIKVVLLWASDVCMEDTFLYDRYGRYLYTEQSNSLAYKATLVALQYFFTTTKSVKNLEVILNILFNLPFAKTTGEVVTGIVTIDQLGNETTSPINFNANARAETQEGVTGVGWFHKITTTQNIYFAPVYAELLVGVGDILSNYQLICRVHRAKDFISDPDWYKDARFPFELVEDLSDYTVLNTPPEFAPYVPHRADSSITYSGDHLYTGTYDVYNGIDPFVGTRSKIDGTEFEQLLYGLVDTVLKHNLLYVQTELNYDNIEYYQKNRISESYEAIAQGVPTYLFPVMETLFKFELIDQFLDTTEDMLAHADFSEPEPAFGYDPEGNYGYVSVGAVYNGEVGFSNPKVHFYDGVSTYGSSGRVPFHPYGGEDCTYYGTESEICKVAYSLVTAEEDTFKVLGLDGVTSPLLQMEYKLYSGVHSADGSVPFTTQLEDEEPLSVGVSLLAEDTVEPFGYELSMGMSFEDEEYGVMGYTGEVTFSNATPVTYGSTFLEALIYDETMLWDGTTDFSGFKVTKPPITFDGSTDYHGYNSVRHTYGANLPWGIQIYDTLEVEWMLESPFIKWEDSFPVLSFDGPSPLLQIEDILYSGVYLADGSISFGGQLEDAEPLNMMANQELDDTINTVETTLYLGADIKDEEYGVSGYTGEVTFNNATPVTYGSTFLEALVYDETMLWDGTTDFSGFKVTKPPITFDGSTDYHGYNSVRHTYGSNLPGGIQVLDSLEVTWTPLRIEVRADLDDTFPVLSFDGASPLLQIEDNLYSGVYLADGSISFGSQLEDAEPLNVMANLELDDTLSAAETTLYLGADVTEEEFGVSGYTGEVTFNNTTPVTYGSSFLEAFAYDGALTLDGTVGFSDYKEKKPPIKFNGVNIYQGYNEVRYTYGSNLPMGMQVTDSLDVVWTQVS